MSKSKQHTGGPDDNKIVILKAIERWKQVAVNEIDNIGAWRNVEDKIFYIGWEKIPNGFFTDTSFILSHIANRYPNLNPDPIQKIYKAVHRWYETRNAENIPPQTELVLTCDLAVQAINVLETGILQQAIDIKTAPAIEPPEIGIEEQAIGVLVKYPEWTLKQIADKIGCNEKSLTNKRTPKFMQARKILKASRQDLPTGENPIDPETGQHNLEAWDKTAKE